MSDPVRLALVGCGGISGSHVAGYRSLYENGCREFRVTACCDPIRQRAEERARAIAQFQDRKPEIYTETGDVIRAGIADAADLCLPHYCHHSVAIRLLEAGLHVQVEKPVGITVQATKLMIEAARKAGCILATAENVRRDLAPRAWTWAIRERRLIGRVHMVVIQSVAFGLRDFDASQFKWRAIKELAGGGMIMDSGAHFADMIQVLFGEPDEVRCWMDTFDRRLVRDAPVVGDRDADVEDAWHAEIRFRKGPEVVWTYANALAGHNLSNAVYYGENGAVLAHGFAFHPFQGGGEAHLADGTTVSNQDVIAQYRATLSPEREQQLFPYGCTQGFAIEVWDFIDAVRTGRTPEMDGEAGLRAKALCEACYESADSGRVVRYRDVLEGQARAYQAPIDEFWHVPAPSA
ncbi:MAG: Gfo/Idh/MocA family oxidoreductase [Kiritimatiellaeota bacterium]|nr:Gfo/Idh/MocA family oxidoreductase [Kiritimatiellota bacterium]